MQFLNVSQHLKSSDISFLAHVMFYNLLQTYRNDLHRSSVSYHASLTHGMCQEVCAAGFWRHQYHVLSTPLDLIQSHNEIASHDYIHIV